MTDPAGNWRRYTSDTLGNLVKVEEPNPAYGQADNTATNFVTTYTYDVEGHLIQVQMPRPNGGGSYTQTRTFSYDLPTGHLLSARIRRTAPLRMPTTPTGDCNRKRTPRGKR